MHMNIIQSRPRWRTWLMAVTLGTLAAGCNRDEILGTNVNGAGTSPIAGLVPAVTSVTPVNTATGVPTNTLVTATFNEPMAPISGMASMVVTCLAPCVNPTGVVTLNATNTVATFTLTAGTILATSTEYTVTITGATSLASGVAMAGPYDWKFTTASTPFPLASAAAFGIFGGTAGMTNTGILTMINDGSIGTIATATSSITGFNDTAGDIYTETPANIGAVSGTIYTCTTSTTGPTSAAENPAYCTIATQARLDAQTAYQALVALPPGANPGANLGGLTLAPGVYTAPAGSFMIEGGDLTLNAQGNANAVWVFQMATTLTVGGPGATAPESIILAGGAQAKNVFWQVGSAATINAAGGGTMVGTIISQAGAAISTVGNTAIVTLDGRVLSLGASVTMTDTVINVPAP
jgi:hypothetical protein